MSSDAVAKFAKMDYILLDSTQVDYLPSDLIPTIITEDGIFIETIPNNEDLSDGLFIAYGKLITLKKFFQKNNLSSNYTVLLLLSSKEFKKLHPELRKSIFSEIPILVV